MWGSLACALFAAANGASESAPQRWAVDPLASRAEFNVRFLGLVKINGRFARFTASIDPAGDDTLRVEARFETASLDMSTDQQERWARSDEFFDSEHYPSIEYRSEPFAREMLEHGGEVKGALTLRGETHDTALALHPVDCRIDAHAPCVLDAAASVARTAFGMKTRRGMISDRVGLALHIVARPAAVDP